MTVPLSNLTDTWNASGTTWKGIQLNVTDTGHSAASMLLDLQIGGTSVFNVDPSGVVDAGTTEAVFMQSGDTFGTTRLRMRNRSFQNGAVVENAGLDLSELVLLSSTAAQGSLRFEHRSGSLLNSSNSSGELQFLVSTSGAAFAVGTSSIDINGASTPNFRVYNSGADLGDILLGGTAPGTNWGNVRYEHRSGQFMDSANTAGEMQFLVGGNQIVGHGPSVHSLRNGTTAQTLRVYNTYTDASNYERGVFDWATASNVLSIGTQKAGTGSTRNLQFLVGGSAVADYGITNSGMWFLNGGISLNSGLSIIQPYGGGNPGVKFVGSGTPLGIGGSSSGGNTVTLDSGAVFGWSSTNVSTFGYTVDVQLWRDSQDTLGQRRGGSAQNSRVYNTWTDSSNYECGVLDWRTTSNVLTIGAQAAGTGTLRAVKLVGSDITIKGDTATPAGGSTAARLLFGTTSGFGIYYGSGAPTVSAAAGSLYIRTDNAGANLRLYSNTTGSTTWAAITSA